MQALDQFEEDDAGTVFRDVITLALCGFVAVVILLLPHIRPEAKQADTAGVAAPGNVMVEARWPDELDADDVRLRSWVNGEPRQDSRTADLIFSIDTIVCDLSRHLRLEPGDLILTGTPEGVALSGRFPYLRPGDVVEVEIEGLGRQRQVYA